MADEGIKIPGVLVPKTGTRTSSFWVLIAAWLVGGLFTGLFTYLEANGFLDREGAPLVRGWLVDVLADLLPIAYLGVSGWLTKQYIAARGRIAERKAEAMGMAVQAQMPGSTTSSTYSTSTVKE